MLSKTQLIEKLVASSDGLSKKGVKDLLQGLADIAHKELKKSGAFVVPGLAKFVMVKKPATKTRSKTDFQMFFDLILWSDWRNVHAGESRVRPPPVGRRSAFRS